MWVCLGYLEKTPIDVLFCQARIALPLYKAFQFISNVCAIILQKKLSEQSCEMENMDYKLETGKSPKYLEKAWVRRRMMKCGFEKGKRQKCNKEEEEEEEGGERGSTSRREF